MRERDLTLQQPKSENTKAPVQGNKLLFRLEGISEYALHESETEMFAIHELCKISLF